MKYGMKYGASKTKVPTSTAGVKGVNVKESRLNAGGDMAFKGKRTKVKKTNYKSM